jgi:hypothetical protein
MPQAAETAVFALSEGLARRETLSGTGPSELRRLSEPLLLPSATAVAAASATTGTGVPLREVKSLFDKTA